MGANFISSFRRISKIILQASAKMQIAVEQPFEPCGQAGQVEPGGGHQAFQKHQGLQSKVGVDFQGIRRVTH